MIQFYNRYVLPRAIDLACGYRRLSRLRARVVPQASGVVVEFGIGSGHNLAFYDPNTVRHVIGIDPAANLVSLGKARYAASSVDVETRQGTAETCGLDRAMADTVVFTYTLCSVGGVEASLEQVRRILKPHGRLLFLEHGLAPEAQIAARQRRWTPITVKFAGGCHLDRDMEALICQSGFAFDWLEKRWIKRMPKTSSFQYYGAARVI